MTDTKLQDTIEDTTTEFTTDAQTTHRPVDMTTELEVTTITELLLTNIPDTFDDKETKTKITFTEVPSVLTNIP